MHFREILGGNMLISFSYIDFRVQSLHTLERPALAMPIALSKTSYFTFVKVAVWYYLLPCWNSPHECKNQSEHYILLRFLCFGWKLRSVTRLKSCFKCTH